MHRVEQVLLGYAEGQGLDWDFWSEEVTEGYGETVPDLGYVEVVQKKTGGYDDEGPIHLVLKVTARNGHVSYYKKEGSYYSYSGQEWEGVFREVSPNTKQVIVYE